MKMMFGRIFKSYFCCLIVVWNFSFRYICLDEVHFQCYNIVANKNCTYIKYASYEINIGIVDSGIANVDEIWLRKKKHRIFFVLYLDLSYVNEALSQLRICRPPPSLLISLLWMMGSVLYSTMGKIIKKFFNSYFSSYCEKFIENWRFIEQKWP